MNSKIKMGVIGNGKMAIQCMNIILNQPSLKLDFIIFNPKIDNAGKELLTFAIQNNFDAIGFEKLNSEESVETIKKYQPDYIISVNNFRIIKKEIIEIPKVGIINFHDAFLPSYKGVNIPFWVVLNGEKKHGITWHFINEGIDTGDIINQIEFDIPEGSTAATLTLLCIKKGVECFHQVVNNIAENNLKRIKQEPGGDYYSYKMFPENKGIINFNDKFEKIDKLVRGLNYFPFENNFCYSKIRYNDKDLIINSVSKIDKISEENGKIIKIDEDNLCINCSDSTILIDDMMLDYNNFLTPLEAANYLGIKEGDIINS